MTVRLLRESLDEMGEPYNKTSKKAELKQKVKVVRKRMESVAESSTSSQGREMTSGPFVGTTMG